MRVLHHSILELQFYNLAVHPTTPFHRLCLWLISLLMGLLALGPFLHAHYGATGATGFHVNGLQAVVVTQASGRSTQTPTLSLPTEQESPAMGVVTSLPRSEAEPITPDNAMAIGPSFLALSILHRVPSTWFGALGEHPTSGRIFRVGLPPPAHAPPISL